MITLRPAQERGIANFGWLDSRHTFSFGHYYDPNYMGFSSLRVINEDKVIPSKGFPPHGHREMEIITYIINGALEHKDSVGNTSIIRPGDVQRMSAGTGIQHSEYNASKSEPVHLLQIWILPDTQGLNPSYEEKHFSTAEKQGKLKLIGSRNGRETSVTIHQDVDLYASILRDGETVEHSLVNNRKAWIQVVKGSLQLENYQLYAGDGVAISSEKSIALTALSDESELLLFDLGSEK
ncbi:Pirin domain protein [Rippkaea orientalis PCC 8801]|uniref:Pirin domain protein n=1 Tax=Rippkaea orientalis (strain PCC 8801 / RF-1) TaxID=41431 RepID=B7K1I5_RIPO1|nr:pirin family protein [Rippkaea orientalis]ACK67527.1 Pirin domain protein [Rippkaea orientalis PCC 8801]